MPDQCKYTLVLGVDERHLRQLDMVWPTWMHHKNSSILRCPIVIFYDTEQLTEKQLRAWNSYPTITYVPWPPAGASYEAPSISGRWGKPQRSKMLSGFIHVASQHVQTEWWWKLDTDVTATGCPDWIDEEWFLNDNTVIVSQSWPYTKPADQMLQLDAWAEQHAEKLAELKDTKPLNLRPKPGSDLLRHKRIISWCSFFRTSFTQMASSMAARTCGEGKLPVPSQDGYLFYLATRLGLGIVKPNMKALGWAQRLNESNIQKEVKVSLGLSE